MTAVSSTRTLSIRVVGGQGDGIADGGVFVPLTLPGECVSAGVTGDRGELIAVLEASASRVAPPCPHFGACGGCALQHWDLGAYRAWKVEQVRLALARAQIDAPVTLAFAAEPHSRRRLALHTRRASGGAVVGFKKRRSWTLAPIEVCVIADRRLAAALPWLRALALPFLEHPKSAPTLHVTVTDTGLDIDVTGVERRDGGLSADARMRVAGVANVSDCARVTVAGEIAYQARPPLVRFGSATVALPPGAFLQAVAGAEQAMGDLIVEAASGAKSVADLYCGAGAFTFRLAMIAPVLAADASAPAVLALGRAAATTRGAKPIVVQTRDLDRRPMLSAELSKTDVVVFDPPRAGAAAQAAQLAASKVPRVVAVSCNLATFLRDTEILIAGGYRLDRLAVVDQFLWSPHIELVAIFLRLGASGV